MPPHYLKQDDEALARLRCFGMVRSKYLLPDAQRSLVERLGLSTLTLLMGEVRQTSERVGSQGMLWPQLLLPDGLHVISLETNLRTV
jgi:hypothetical protein